MLGGLWPQPKFEALNPKSETISNYRNSNVQNKNLDMKRDKMHKINKKTAKKVLYKDINSWIPA